MHDLFDLERVVEIRDTLCRNYNLPYDQKKITHRKLVHDLDEEYEKLYEKGFESVGLNKLLNISIFDDVCYRVSDDEIMYITRI